MFFKLFGVRISPANFGEPTSRGRWFRIVRDTNLVEWSVCFSFEELCKILLSSPDAALKVGPEIFMSASEEEIEKARGRYLCPSASKFLEEYNQAVPEKRFLDLSTNPAFARRTELVSGALMTLTTNVKIWSGTESILEINNCIQIIRPDAK